MNHFNGRVRMGSRQNPDLNSGKPVHSVSSKRVCFSIVTLTAFGSLYHYVPLLMFI